MQDFEGRSRSLTPEEARNRATVAAVYSDFATGNMKALLGRLAANVKWTVVAGATTGGTYYGGRQALEKALDPLLAEWNDFEYTPFELTPVDDRVFVLGESRGVHQVTGKVGAATFVHIWFLEDGVVQRFENVFDTHALWRATQQQDVPVLSSHSAVRTLATAARAADRLPR
ncbi:nuclear transport factor 2 family protein [Nonomuraea sp. SYSU D8015]|uniref:nuclear transport factor 2 family protein n=1 Tax=Nonomuraea sp. SYSU D8015 TaxID=2593644 RepID=UPI001660118D|nr:nuclear transport factor 2 family protein [Nonomuraea sp. SYSU D8015]